MARKISIVTGVKSWDNNRMIKDYLLKGLIWAAVLLVLYFLWVVLSDYGANLF